MKKLLKPVRKYLFQTTKVLKFMPKNLHIIKKKNFKILDNVIFLDENNLLNINSNKIEFDEINNVITTFGETKINHDQSMN